MRKSLLFLVAAAVAAGAQAAPFKAAKAHRAADGAPVVLPATNVTANGFTANWKAVPGVDGYSVMVFTKTTVPADGTYTVAHEDFNLIAAGSVIEPYWVDEYMIDLSAPEWDVVMTPNWSAGPYPSFAGGKIGGVIYSPYMDLTNNGGKYTVEIGVQGQAGAEYMVRSVGTGAEQRQTKKLPLSGYNTLTFEFDNGSHDTFLVFVDNGFPDDPYDESKMEAYCYLDDVAVMQDLRAGDEVLQLVDINEAVDAPATSCDFTNMRFLYGATTVYYDVIGASLYYPDPDDWYYETTYTPYSDLQRVDLAAAGISDITTNPDADTPAAYFNLSGQQVNPEALAPGIYIERRGSHARKVAIK